MKLEYIGVAELFNDKDEVILAKLLAAHQAIRQINIEQKLDVELNRAIKAVEDLKAPYRRRILRQRSIVSAGELVARARDIILPEDKTEDN